MVSAKADERLTLFLQQFEKLQKYTLPLDHPDSPFLPYLGVKFEDGLNDGDMAAFLNAQQSGDCFQVGQLKTKGFLGLYPFLKPAFTDYQKGGKVRFMLDHGYMGPFSRCNDLKFLKRFQKSHRLADFKPVNMAIEVEAQYLRLKGGGAKTAQDELISLLFSFGKNAFCRDYHLSVLDVLTMANRPGGIVLTQDEQLYLVERARHHGSFGEEEYLRRIETLGRTYASSGSFEEIRRASRENKLHKINVVRGFWRSACLDALKHNL